MFYTMNSCQDNSRTYSPNQTSVGVKFLSFWEKQVLVSHWVGPVSKNLYFRPHKLMAFWTGQTMSTWFPHKQFGNPTNFYVYVSMLI